MPRLTHRIVCVGRRANDPFLEAADGYLARLGRYAQVELVRLRDGTSEREAAQMLEKTPAGAAVLALDERGHHWSTQQLSDYLGNCAHAGPSCIVYYVGGADGLGEAARRRAGRVWSLSLLTLPHRAALAILTEQLYRAHTVLCNEPYHRP